MSSPTTQTTEWPAELEGYLRETWGDPTVRVSEPRAFGKGNSGFTFLLTLESRKYNGRVVARLSPPNIRISGPTDMGRQARIMAALSSCGLPVPAVYAADSRPVVAGRSFALTERVSGETFDQVRERLAPDVIAREAIGFLSRLSRVPVEATGLGDERRASWDDEVARWTRLMDRAPNWLSAEALSMHELLTSAAVSTTATGLVHGDYHYGNMLFEDGRIVAVLDWEIAEIGDPVLDIGSLVVASLRRRYDPDPNPAGGLAISVNELVALAGATPETIRWSTALNCYKYAAILGYNLNLHRSGKRVDPIYEQLTGTMLGLLRDGERIARKGLDGL